MREREQRESPRVNRIGTRERANVRMYCIHLCMYEYARGERGGGMKIEGEGEPGNSMRAKKREREIEGGRGRRNLRNRAYSAQNSRCSRTRGPKVL